MSALNGRQLIAATMHTNIFSAGAGEIKKELSALDNGLSRGVKMTIDEPFVILEIVDKQVKNKTHTISVPLTNFSHMVLAKE